MRLRNLLISPPGNWSYTQPETGVRMTAVTFQSLIGKVVQHRQNNKLDVANVYSEVEAAICASLSPEDQVANCVTGTRERRSVGWAEIVSFSTWLTKWWTGGRQLVEPEEANRRAAICATCPYNVGVTGCSVCRTSIGVLRNKLMRVTPTTSDNKLLACGICGCDLKTIAHVPLDTLEKSSHDYSKVSWCWRNKQSSNYAAPRKQ